MEDSSLPWFFANNVLVHNSCFFLAMPMIEYRYGKKNHSEEFLVEKTLDLVQLHNEIWKQEIKTKKF